MTTNEIQARDSVLLFVYGTLKTGGRLNSAINRDNKSICIGDGTILTKNFVMRDLGAYPGLQKVATGSGTYIHGEVWLVSKTTLCGIDTIEGYPNKYTRDQVTCWLDGKNDTSYYAWVYHLNISEDNECELQAYSNCHVISSGTWDAVNNTSTIKFFDCHDCGVTCNDGIKRITSEGEQVCDACYAKNHANEDETGPVWKDTTRYSVDRGIYVSNEYGDHWGPCETIQDAVCAIVNGDIEVEGSDCLTIGFRMICADANDDDLATISALTREI